MTEDELKAIEERARLGARVDVDRDAGTVTASVPVLADVPALVAEVRRLRGQLENERRDAEMREAELRKKAWRREGL